MPTITFYKLIVQSFAKKLSIKVLLQIQFSMENYDMCKQKFLKPARWNHKLLDLQAKDTSSSKTNEELEPVVEQIVGAII